MYAGNDGEEEKVAMANKIGTDAPLTPNEIKYLRDMIQRDKRMKLAEERQLQSEQDFDDAIRRDMS